MKETINPIIITNNDTGEKYTLEFTRETVKFAERHGFDFDNIDRYPMTTVPELFYYAFRAHHKSVTKDNADKILFEDLGGISNAMVKRLGQLYTKPFEELTCEDGETKNAKMTVEF